MSGSVITAREGVPEEEVLSRLGILVEELETWKDDPNFAEHYEIMSDPSFVSLPWSASFDD